MAEDFDRLTEAFRKIARDDAARAPRRPEPRVVEVLRARQLSTDAAVPAGPGRWVGLGIAATLASALAGSLWMSASRPPLGDAQAPLPARREVATAFLPLAYSAVPYTSAQIVRLEVPRASLKNFGLAPADLTAEQASAASQNTVLADVLVGEDGLARAVRFVRTQRSQRMAP